MAPQGVQVVGILQRRGATAQVRPRLAHLGGGEEDRLGDLIEIALLAHAPEQDRAHHAAPTDEPDTFHSPRPKLVRKNREEREIREREFNPRESANGAQSNRGVRRDRALVPNSLSFASSRT
jgi:hypothetical protein